MSRKAMPPVLVDQPTSSTALRPKHTSAKMTDEGQPHETQTAANITVLIINPNSTPSITDALKGLLANLIHPGLSLAFFTAPHSAPPSIDDEATSALSTSETLPTLLPLLSQSHEDVDAPQPQPPHRDCDRKHDAYLIACYSPHPLTDILRAHTSAPVLNIFEASIIQAKAMGRPFGIVTTGRYWEYVLTKGVQDFLDRSDTRVEGDAAEYRFVGVRSTGLSAVELHSTSKEEVDTRIAQATAGLVCDGAEVVLLGCAGMSGMEDAVVEGARSKGKDVVIIDGVKAGVILLEGSVKAGSR